MVWSSAAPTTHRHRCTAPDRQRGGRARASGSEARRASGRRARQRGRAKQRGLTGRAAGA